MGPHDNEILLEHPSGANVLLVGTQHVSCTHGSRVSTVVERLRPSAVLLELDQARFNQVDFRLRHLLHFDTSSLMEMTADTGAGSSVLQRLLPDALLWGQHMQQFALMRNEGVPLLLGSLYGADFLQAALAASALPEQATIVLADQPQQLTMARFKALTDTLGGLRQMLGSVFGTAHAAAYPCPQAVSQQQQHQGDWQLGLSTATLYHSTTSSSHNESMGLLWPAQQLQRIFTAAAQLAAGRMVHLCLEWWSMALTGQARWYGDNIHPVFLLVGNPELQQRLAARGCQGVSEAAAAAGRLLEVAAASSRSLSSGSGSMVARGGLPAVEDLQAIRTFVSSLEGVMWSSAGEAAAGPSSSSSSSRACSSSSGSSSTRGSSQVMHWLEQQPAGVDAAGFSELMPLRPWWVTLSESFSHRLAQLSSPAADSSSSSLSAALQSHQHANITAAAAYDQAVMAERNQVLTAALWQHTAAAATLEAEAAAAAAAGSAGRSHTAAVVDGGSSGQQQQQHAAVVAVVGYNHLPGIAQLWRELQQQAAGSSKYGGTLPGSFAAVGSSQHAFLPWQVTMTDAVAGVLELAAAGGAGLCYWAGINRWAPASTASATAAAAAAGGSSSSSGLARLAAKARSGPGMRRLGLLLLPAAVALLPLQRDAKRLQEAGGLLSKVAVANDVILGQEARELAHQQQQQCAGGGPSSSIMQLAYRAQAVAAAMP